MMMRMRMMMMIGKVLTMTTSIKVVEIIQEERRKVLLLYLPTSAYTYCITP